MVYNVTSDTHLFKRPYIQQLIPHSHYLQVHVQYIYHVIQEPSINGLYSSCTVLYLITYSTNLLKSP